MFVLPRASSLLAFSLSLFFTIGTASAVDIPGDFNGDGRLDALLQPSTITEPGAIMLRDGTGNLTVLVQQWDAGYLGLDWSAVDSNLTAADLNGDGQDDVVLQPRKAGQTAAVLLTDPTIQLTHISQLLPAGYLGLDWSSAANLVTAADFDGDRRKELFLQSTQEDGPAVIVHADAAGRIVAAVQQLPEGFLGRHWDAEDETVYVGDFNGDGRQDLLVQSHLGGKGESSYALLLADPDGRFSRLAETWNDNDLGANWDPASHRIVITDANGDGISDIELLSTRGGQNYLFESDAQGQFTQPASHWTGNQPAPLPTAGSGGKSGSGSGISVVRTGLTANTISAPTNPEQDPTIQRTGVTQAQGSGQIMTVNAAGTMAGSGGVSGGTATYSIPISVPPGIAGMQPSISLNYSSRGGNGEMGMGWSLGAGSQIHRCPATRAMDGYSSGVTYTANDRLCLDGQHLVLVSGVYGHDGATYRTELDGFSLVTEIGDISSGQSHFTVDTKSGHEMRYGYGTNIGSSPNAVFTPSGAPAPLAWGLGIEVDQHNNSVIYYYSTFGAGEFLLTSINYTGLGATAGNREVDFSYSTRDDFSSQYLAGGLTMQTQVLSTVSTNVNGQLLHKYSMDYASSGATARTLLVGVQQCGFSSGTEACLPENTFGWHAPTTRFNLATSIDLDFDPNAGAPDAISTSGGGDFDGDGRKDLVFLAAPLRSTVYFLNADGSVRGGKGVDISDLFGAGTVPWDESADLNNDGATDLLGSELVNGNPTFEYSSYKDGVFQKPKPLNVPSTITFHGQTYSDFVAATDVDGDGRADIVVTVADPAHPGNHMLAVYLNQTPPCGQPGCSSIAAFSSTPTPLISLPDHTDPSGQAHMLIAKPAGDMDGNGLPDFEVSYYDASNASHDGWVFTHEDSNGNLITQQSVTDKTVAGVSTLAQDGRTNPRMMDINGDGLPDIVYDCDLSNHDWCYQLNVGGSFSTPVDTGVFDGVTGAVVTADVDGDGVQEMLAPGTMLADYCVFEGDYTSPDTGTKGPAWTCADQTDGDYWVPQLSSGQDHSIYEYGSYKFIPQADPNAEDHTGFRYVPHYTDLNIQGQNGFAQAMDLLGDGLTGLVSPFTTGGSESVKFIKKNVEPVVFGLGISSNSASSGNSWNAAPDLMISTFNGLGHQDRWDYYPLSSPLTTNGVALYESPAANGGYGGDDYFYFSSSMYVVGRYSASNGVSGMNEHDFHYGQAIYNNQGRGFQGFRTVVDDDDVSGARTVQVYHQRFPLSGLLQESWTTSQQSSNSGSGFDLLNPVMDSGKVDHVQAQAACNVGQGAPWLSASGYVVDDITCRQNMSAKTFFPFVAQTTETKYDVNSHDILSTTTITNCQVSNRACGNGAAYDSYGNLQGSVTVVADAQGTHTTSAAYTYFAPDLSGWWVDKLQEKITTTQIGTTAAPPVTRTTDYDYYSNRDLYHSYAHADGNAANEIDTEYVYDRGNVTKVTVTGGSGTVGVGTAISTRSTSTTYSTGTDADYFVATVTDPVGLVTSYQTDPRFGSPTLITAPDGVPTSKSYDVFGRLISTQVGSLPAQTIQYITHVSGDGCATPQGLASYFALVNQAGAPGHYTCYDTLGRAIRQATESFSSAGELVYVDTYYDTHGRVTKVSEPYFSSQTPRWNVKHYDDSNVLGRMDYQTDAKGVKTAYTYADLTTDIETTTPNDPLNPGYDRVDEEKKNSLGKLLAVTNAMGAPEQASTSYQYDSDGNPVTIIAADGSQITAVYDVLGHKTDVTDPDQGHTGYTYDVLGELLSQTDAKGQTQSMSYDRDGRMLTKSTNVAGEDPAAWTYDTCANGAGKLCSVVQGAGTAYQERYVYDGYGRVTTDDEQIDGIDYDTDTAYNSLGQVDTVTYPSSIADAPPTANAGATQYAAPNDLVTLSGSGSDTDGPQPVAYQWSQTAGPAVSLSSTTDPNASFTTGSTPGTTYTFSLVADDGLSASASSSVNVIIPALPAAPAGLTDDGDTNHDGYYVVAWDRVTDTGANIIYHLEEAGGNSAGPTQAYSEYYVGGTPNASISHPGNGYYYYYYRVRVEARVNGKTVGYGPYSSVDGIHVVVRPGPPGSISPSNGTTTTGTYTVSWGVNTGAVSPSLVYYVLDESSTSTFTSTYQVYSGTSRSLSITAVSLGDYYYEVAACNANNGVAVCSSFTRKALEIVNGTGGGGGQCPPTGCVQTQTQINPAPTPSPAPSPGTVGMVQAADTGAIYASVRGERGTPALTKLALTSPTPPMSKRGTRSSVSGRTLLPSGEGKGMRAASAPTIASRWEGPNSHVRPHYALPVYQAWAHARLADATSTTPVARFSVKYIYTANGYLWQLASGVDPNRIYWSVNKSSAGTDPAGTGDYSEYGMDARGNPVDVYAGGGAVHTVYGYGPASGYLASIKSDSSDGSVAYQNMSYQWFATGNLQSRSSIVGSTNLQEAFHYDLHNRLLDSTVTNAAGAQPMVTYAYDSMGDLTCKSDVVNHDCNSDPTGYTYGGTAGPHAVTGISGAGSYSYDADGNMTVRNGTTVTWNSDNMATAITQDANDSSAFSYAPDKHRYKQVAMNGGVQETTLYVGGLEIFTSASDGVTHYKHTITAYGRPVLLDDLTNNGTAADEAKSALLTDHLGSVDTVVDLSSPAVQSQSFTSFGQHRDPATWGTMAANTVTVTRQGYTGHEQLDAVGLVHMNGRVYDPVVGRFLSVDPVFQAPSNSQSVNPYSYVMNNPLSLVDPSGYCASTDASTGGDDTGCDGGGAPRVYKGHNDTGTMDHLGSQKLANFDKAVAKANAALKAVFGKDVKLAFDGHGNAEAAVTGNGAEVRQKIDIALGDTGKTGSDKGGQTSLGDISTVGSEIPADTESAEQKQAIFGQAMTALGSTDGKTVDGQNITFINGYMTAGTVDTTVKNDDGTTSTAKVLVDKEHAATLKLAVQRIRGSDNEGLLNGDTAHGSPNSNIYASATLPWKVTVPTAHGNIEVDMNPVQHAEFVIEHEIGHGKGNAWGEAQADEYASKALGYWNH